VGPRRRHLQRTGDLFLWLVAVSLGCLCLCQGAWALGLGSVALKAKAKAKGKGGNKGRISLYRLNNNRYNATCLDGRVSGGGAVSLFISPCPPCLVCLTGTHLPCPRCTFTTPTVLKRDLRPITVG